VDIRVSSAPETSEGRGGGVHFLPVETDTPERPESAIRLGANRAAFVERLQPDAVAAGNAYYLLQIESHLQRRNGRLPGLHTVELLDRAYGSA